MTFSLRLYTAIIDKGKYDIGEADKLNYKPQKSARAIIVLHEIYGVNQFIKDRRGKLEEAGFDVFCPDMLGRAPFPYVNSEVAYEYFSKTSGFEKYKEINGLIDRISIKYDDIFIIGFSAGATVAWRCCENPLCSGIIACYGSRIRDYTELEPACKTLLLFASKDSFDVQKLIKTLENKSNLSVIEFDAEHGFLDKYSGHYDIQQAKPAEEAIDHFLKTGISK